MKNYIIIGVLVIFFIYMIIWSLKLYFFSKRQQKVKRGRELRAKGNEIKKNNDTDLTDYWYNLREAEGRTEEKDIEEYYHYFNTVEQCVKDLLIEMYDFGIVRIDEIEKIAYGKKKSRNVDLSFLKELEQEILGKESIGEVSEKEEDVDITIDEKHSDNTTSDNEDSDDIIQVEGITDDFFQKKQPDVVAAARELGKDDPGIMDIQGTLSVGVENVIAAVDAEKKEQEKKNEPFIIKEEINVEEARKAREMTSNPEVRNQIYEKWVGYVADLYKLIKVQAKEETKQRVHKALLDYGHNDVDVLLQSPE